MSVSQNQRSTEPTLWTNLKTGFIVLFKELQWILSDLVHDMEIRQLHKQANQEEALLGHLIVDNSLTEQNAAQRKKELAQRERILFIRQEIIRLNLTQQLNRQRHVARLKARFQAQTSNASN